jgi:hypothetical protein
VQQVGELVTGSIVINSDPSTTYGDRASADFFLCCRSLQPVASIAGWGCERAVLYPLAARCAQMIIRAQRASFSAQNRGKNFYLAILRAARFSSWRAARQPVAACG